MPRLFLALLATAITAAARPPNIVWIIADDLSPELGCYGYRGVRTPNIDRLATGGTLFTAAFSTSPVCSPSRSALITGRYQTSIGAHQHRTMEKLPPPEGVAPITEHLRAAGYRCTNLKGMGANAKTDYNFRWDGPVFDSANLPGGDAPFFLQVSFFEPHRRFKNKGEPNGGFSIPPQYPDHPAIRADWADYLADIEALDTKVGRVLQWLEDAGHADDTAVFFFGDHGRPHVWDKQWLYDGGIRVPLIVRWPGGLEPNTRDDRLVSLIDISAQTLAIAGAELPDTLDGQPFLGPDAAHREHIIAARDRSGDAFERIRCVRTERYKYIRNFYPELPYWQTSRYKAVQYPTLAVLKELHARSELAPAQARFFADRKPAEELYDLADDHYETTNLAENPAHLEALMDLRSTLDNWISETGDQGATPEPLPLYDAAVGGSAQHFKSFKPDGWHHRSETIRLKLRERSLRPECQDAPEQ